MTISFIVAWLVSPSCGENSKE